jgi:hypothetical protein
VFPLRYNHRENAHKRPGKAQRKDALESIRCIFENQARCVACGEDESYDQAARWISTGQLNPLQGLHTQPINLVVFEAPLGDLRPGTTHLKVGFTLICVQRLSRPNIATEQPPLAG